MPKAPRQRPSLHPPSRAQPTPETNSKLDRNWGQRHGYGYPSKVRLRSGSFGFETPQLALDLRPRSGPIVVKIEYSIANVETFLDQTRKCWRIQSRVCARISPCAPMR
ncbi:MAG: hypothetical protein E5Y86_16730 [Mesorhizobium sp.]|nr:MAG: hypothetical protein E5Y86_16730 [Mesorhizobium sp.]